MLLAAVLVPDLVLVFAGEGLLDLAGDDFFDAAVATFFGAGLLLLPVAGDAALFAGAFLAGVADLFRCFWASSLTAGALRLLVLPAILRANNNVCWEANQGDI